MPRSAHPHWIFVRTCKKAAERRRGVRASELERRDLGRNRKRGSIKSSDPLSVETSSLNVWAGQETEALRA